MNKYKIQLTPRTRASITRIVDQLEEEVSKTTAQHVQKGIMDTIRKLETFPEAHKVFEEISTEQVIYRQVYKWKYKIVFTVDNDKLEVVVVKVYHGRRGSEWVEDQFK